MNAMATAAASGDTLLTQEEAALRLRLSAHTLARWRHLGTGPKWQRIGNKRIAYALSDINAFLAKA